MREVLFSLQLHKGVKTIYISSRTTYKMLSLLYIVLFQTSGIMDYGVKRYLYLLYGTLRCCHWRT